MKKFPILSKIKSLNDSFASCFQGSVTSISALNSIISGMQSSERRLLLLNGTVSDALIDHNAASFASITKMDSSGIADIMIYSLGGNYFGTVRYTSSTSTVSKEIELTSKQAAVTGGALPLYVSKVQNIIYLRALYISPSQAITAGQETLVGVLPDGYRPSATSYIGGVFTNGSGNTFGFRGSIATDGKIRLIFEKAIATSDSLFGTAVAVFG